MIHNVSLELTPRGVCNNKRIMSRPTGPGFFCWENENSFLFILGNLHLIELWFRAVDGGRGKRKYGSV